MYSVLIYAIFGISAAVYLFGYFYIKGYSWKLNQILDNFELENKCKIKIQRNKLLLIINWIDNPALYEAEDENEKMIEEEKKKQAAFQKIKKDQIAPLRTQPPAQDLKAQNDFPQKLKVDNKGQQNNMLSTNPLSQKKEPE